MENHFSKCVNTNRMKNDENVIIFKVIYLIEMFSAPNKMTIILSKNTLIPVLRYTAHTPI